MKKEKNNPIFPMQSNNKTLKICLVILCLLGFRSVGLPQSDGAILFMEKEIWIDLPDYEGLYSFSNFGRVRSHKRQTASERILKPSFAKNYPHYFPCKNGIVGRLWIHRMVALYFVPNPDNKPCVGHKDNDPTNPHYTNLVWCTHSENTYHMMRSNRHPKNRGEMSGSAKLTWKKVEFIRKNSERYSSKELSEKFKVDQRTIRAVITFRYWKKRPYEI